MEVSVDKLKQAVEAQHGRKAMLVTKLPVKDVGEGKTVWGVVHVFGSGRPFSRPSGLCLVLPGREGYRGGEAS